MHWWQIIKGICQAHIPWLWNAEQVQTLQDYWDAQHDLEASKHKTQIKAKSSDHVQENENKKSVTAIQTSNGTTVS